MKANDNVISLRWDQFQMNIPNTFQNVRSSNDFSDVTLISEDELPVEAHRVILSAGSKFFQHVLSRATILKHPHPLLYLKGINGDELESILDFLYLGETSVDQHNLTSFLEAAKHLGIKGLVEEEKVKSEIDQPIYLKDSEDSEPNNSVNNVNSEIYTYEPFDLRKENSVKQNAQPTNVLLLNSKEYEASLTKEETDKIVDKITKANTDYIGKEEIEQKKVIDDWLKSIKPTELFRGKQVFNKQQKVKNDMIQSIDDNFQCKVCDMIYSEETEIDEHIESHSLNSELQNKKERKKYVLKSERKKRSPIWNFTKKLGDIAFCNFCGKKFSKGFSTSNVLTHLKKHHKEEIRNDVKNVR